MMPNPPTPLTPPASPAIASPAAPPSALAVFRAVFEGVYDLMDHFLFRLRLRPIAQTCRAFALVASCLCRLVRIELTLRLAPGRITPGELARLCRVWRQLQYLSGKSGELMAAFLKAPTAPPAAPAPSASPQPLPAAPLDAQPQPQAPLPAEDSAGHTPAVTAPFGFSDLPPVQEVSPVQDIHSVNNVNNVHDVHLHHGADPSANPFAPNPLLPASPLLANLAAALRDWNFTRPLYDLARLHPSAASALLAHPGATLVSVIRDLNRLESFFTQDMLARAQSPSHSPSPSQSEMESPSPSPSQSQSMSSSNLQSAFLNLQSGIPHSSDDLPASEDEYVIFQLPNPHCPEQSPSPSPSQSVHSSPSIPHSEFRIPHSTAPP